MYYIQRLHWFFSFFSYEYTIIVHQFLIWISLCVSIFFKLLMQRKPSCPTMREQYYTQQNIWSHAIVLKSVSKPNGWEHIMIDVTRVSTVSIHRDRECKTFKACIIANMTQKYSTYLFMYSCIINKGVSHRGTDVSLTCMLSILC